MTNDADLINDLRAEADLGTQLPQRCRRLLNAAADALAARDAACGHLDNQLVAKGLTFAAEHVTREVIEYDSDFDALQHVVFKVIG
jgi:hypothetical protein